MSEVLQENKKKKSFFKRKPFRYGIIALLLGILLFIVICNRIIINKANGRTYNSVEEIPHNDVGLVLGTNPFLKDGTPNPYFRYRVDAVVALFKAGKIDYVLVSGDNRVHHYNEPEAFKKELVQRGIPEARIFLDYAGFRTLDSMVRAKEVFGQTKITVISQKFHNERALFIAHKNGIEAIGFNAHDVPANLGFKTNVREYLARVKLFIDILFSVNPKFLGEKIHIDEQL